MKVKVGAYSSVFGGSVHLHEDDGRFAGQIAIMCNIDTLRDPALQKAMCEVMAKALAQFFAAAKGGAA